MLWVLGWVTERDREREKEREREQERGRCVYVRGTEPASPLRAGYLNVSVGRPTGSKTS